MAEAARQGLVLVIRGLSRPKRSIEWLNALMEMDVGGTTLYIGSVKLSVHKDFRIIATYSRNSETEDQILSNAVWTRLAWFDAEALLSRRRSNRHIQKAAQCTKEVDELFGNLNFWRDHEYSLQGREKVLREIANELMTRRGVIVQGGAGCGKTSGLELLSRGLSGHKRMYLLVKKETSFEDLMGSFVPAGGTFQWKDGPLLECIRYGYWIILDEANHATASKLGFLYTFLDPDVTKVYVTTSGEVVDIHPNFRMCFAQNPHCGEYPACYATYGAIMNRVKLVEMPALDSQQMLNVLMAKASKFPDPKTVTLKVCQSVINAVDERKLDQTGDVPTSRHYIRCLKRIALPPMRRSSAYPADSFLKQLNKSYHQNKDSKAFDDALFKTVQFHASILHATIDSSFDFICDFSFNKGLIVFNIERKGECAQVELCSRTKMTSKRCGEIKEKLATDEKKVICLIAFAHAFNEPLCLIGPTSYKSHVLEAFHSLLNFPSSELSFCDISRETIISDLEGKLEPHNSMTCAKLQSIVGNRIQDAIECDERAKETGFASEPVAYNVDSVRDMLALGQCGDGQALIFREGLVPLSWR